MNYKLYYRQAPILPEDFLMLDIGKGDVNGDGSADDTHLLGRKEPDGIVIRDIHVVIRDGRTDQEYYINLNVNKGYAPKLFIGNFTNTNGDDILISIDSGNTGREGYFYIYSFTNNKAKKIFDFEVFNNKYKYDVEYKNNYQVNIISQFINKQFTINLSDKNSNYIAMIYNKNGTLKSPLKGMVSPITELHPVVSESDNGYDLYAIQRVVGYYNADTLGMIITPLRWNGKSFEMVDAPYFTLFGANKTQI